MTEYKTLDEIEAVVLRVKLQLLRGYTYPSEGQWRDDLEDLAAALRSAVGMAREMEKSEAWLEEMNRKMERERDEARAEREAVMQVACSVCGNESCAGCLVDGLRRAYSATKPAGDGGGR
jgi:hypothetical protein